MLCSVIAKLARSATQDFDFSHILLAICSMFDHAYADTRKTSNIDDKQPTMLSMHRGASNNFIVCVPMSTRNHHNLPTRKYFQHIISQHSIASLREWQLNRYYLSKKRTIEINKWSCGIVRSSIMCRIFMRSLVPFEVGVTYSILHVTQIV